MHPVGGIAFILGQWRQGLAKFDDVAVAVFPIVEQVEIVGDVLEGGRVGRHRACLEESGAKKKPQVRGSGLAAEDQNPWSSRGIWGSG